MFNRIEESLLIVCIIMNVIFSLKSLSFQKQSVHCFTLPIHIHNTENGYIYDDIYHPVDCPKYSYTYSEYKQQIFDDDKYIRVEKLCCSKN